MDNEPDRITIGIDDVIVGTVSRSELAAGDAWVFDTPSNILRNIAVGGNFAGAGPSDT